MKSINISISEEHLLGIVNSLPNLTQYLEGPSVEEGPLGAALFYCYYAKYTDDSKYFELAETFLDKATSLISPESYNKKYRTDSYDRLLASYGMFFDFATKNSFLDINLNEYLNPIDEILINLMETKLRVGDLDCWSGALSTGRYLYSRLDSHEHLKNNLSNLVNEIENWSFCDKQGDIYWKSPTLKNNVYFGISHGSSMVISFLVALYEKGIQQQKCKDLVSKAVRFILKHQRQEQKGLFPITLNDTIEPKQFSQCYGDLGVYYGLYRASSILNDISLTHQLESILQSCLNRTFEDGLTWDASMVYGASGVAAVYSKLFRLSNNPIFDAAQNYWYMQIPKYYKRNTEFLGFDTMVKDSPKSMNVSYGWGGIGVGISLMKYIRRDLPHLDAFTMLI